MIILNHYYFELKYKKYTIYIYIYIYVYIYIYIHTRIYIYIKYIKYSKVTNFNIYNETFNKIWCKLVLRKIIREIIHYNPRYFLTFVTLGLLNFYDYVVIFLTYVFLISRLKCNASMGWQCINYYIVAYMRRNSSTKWGESRIVIVI